MATSRQRLSSRLLWFAVGAVLNYALIAWPFKWFSAHTHWPVWVTSACSVGLAAVFFLAWNLFVNFRTDGRLVAVLPRYLVAVIGMWLLSSAVLTTLKHIDIQLASNVGGVPLDFDVIGTQCFLAGLKFALYHKWVFPVSTA
ncbi:MAG: hypothetical protein ABI051_13590 [Vicinamibacterales bacterium]